MDGKSTTFQFLILALYNREDTEELETAPAYTTKGINRALKLQRSIETTEKHQDE
jgi:hypothetical protein